MVDLIDFEYGPRNAWWHTAQDTLDKLSSRSLEVVGRVTEAVLRDLRAGSRPESRHPLPCVMQG